MTLEQVVGVALILLFLADIFLTALYARAGTGLLAPYLQRAIWVSLRSLAPLFGKRRARVLSTGGPLIVLALIGFWALGLAVGAALIIRPELGTSIRPSSGEASTDFVTALLVAGNSLSVVGGGDYAPHTTGTRILFLANSLIGASILSLVLSYLVQVYAALRERNALALTVDLMSDGTGDAAEMLARLMPGGDCQKASSELGNLARSFAATKEAHHFYPLLFYFRFEEPRYSVLRLSFVVLDLVTLIEAALDQRRCGSLAASVPVASLRRGALLLLETFDRDLPGVETWPSGAVEIWDDRQSYAAAARLLAHRGIRAQPNGVEAYSARRREWEPLFRRIAPVLGETMDEIDCRTSGPSRPSQAESR